MSELAAINAIREMGLDAFCETYAISRVEADGLISLKYNQIDSPMHEECVADCRGLVVKASDPTQVVAMAYRKFWNLGEKHAAPIDWASARVMEKLDGSLITMYWHEGRWCVASSGHPTAGGNYNGTSEETFRSMFWQTWAQLGYVVPNEDTGLWYAFELCRPDNRIVVKYERPRIVLHGVRRSADFSECQLWAVKAIAERMGWECVETWPLDGYGADMVATAAAGTDPLALEGFVVVDAAFNRVKVKNPATSRSITSAATVRPAPSSSCGRLARPARFWRTSRRCSRTLTLSSARSPTPCPASAPAGTCTARSRTGRRSPWR